MSTIDLQGIQKRINKYIHGVDGDVSLEDLVELFEQYHYSHRDEVLLNVPPPPIPPPFVNIEKISVLVSRESTTTTKEDSMDKIIETDRENIIKRREENLTQYSHIEVVDKDIYHVPRQKDTLFWCIYIAVNGMTEYMRIDRNYGVKELEIKKMIADDVRKNPTKYKHIIGYRIPKSMIQEVTSELLTIQSETSIYCMMIMMIYYNIQIWLVYPLNNATGKYLKFELPTIEDDEEEERTTHLFYVEENNNDPMKNKNKSKQTKGSLCRYKIYLMEENFVKEKQRYIEDHYILMENFQKPLKSISSYKMEELEVLWKRLEAGGLIQDNRNNNNNRNKDKKMKKADIYAIISSHFT
jgi:hypothetical protein